MKPQLLLAPIIFFAMVCTSCQHGDLEGTWRLTLPAGFEHEVTIQDMGHNEFYLQKGSLNVSGVYKLEKNTLVMSKPIDERLTEFVWRLKSDGTLILIEEPPVAKTGARYLGATLVRIENVEE